MERNMSGFQYGAAQGQELGLERFHQSAARAFLNASEAIFAHHHVGVGNFADICLRALVRFIDAHFCALAAVDAVFTPGDFELGYKFHVQGRGVDLNVIFFWHTVTTLIRFRIMCRGVCAIRPYFL